ncbi:serine hydrolase [Chryseobacterium sp. POL2]|uniref:serine hydrolase n=1 Tax=Chryseobacterium sp. POL2 TaxID=2713414 RepID=UPI0021D1E026|nr:serine hydrolase domain-containing protein [Chryseobacterium sp. POL2]
MLDEIKKQAILFSPHDSISYSNSGYYLLGKIIEKKTNKNFSEVLKQNITKKLKLKNTHSAEENPQNIHLSHIFEDGNWKTKKDFYFKNITAVGDISSSMKDINSFITALFNAKIIKTESLKKDETYSRKRNLWARFDGFQIP